ncbi:MAG TPA: HD domain-containing protein [Mariprofundaceae bacterium]|nr:HD domain-containing protein [Mariprofundaceae bacterium]
MQHSWVTSLPEYLVDVCRHLKSAGGRAWLVGGSVRDLCLGLHPKDFDLEVYGLDEKHLFETAARLGRCEEVGRHFGVIKLWQGHHVIDIALPRTEQKTAGGHRGFDVHPDPHLDPATACRRRDFTINAMMYDPLTDELLDPAGGRDDLDAGTLRHVSGAFVEDPLRPLRGMQFAARFRLRLHPETASLCKKLLAEADTLPVARIWGEWQKWAHAGSPSFGLQALAESSWLSRYPELAALVGCPQPPRWHPEGDVWNHTLQAVDQAARIADERKLSANDREHLLFATLCHDLGKPACTTTDASGRVVSPGHSEHGIEITAAFLTRIGAPGRILENIRPLIREHMCHMHSEPTPRAVRRLAARLSPQSIVMWEMLVEADASGRAPAPPSRPALAWLQAAEAMQHQHEKPVALVNGHLLADLGVTPGPAMGALLAEAYAAQLDGEFDNADDALTWCHRHLPDTGQD